MNTQRIKVNIVYDGRIPPFYASTGDHGASVFECEVYDGLEPFTIPSNCSVVMNLHRPDNHEVILLCDYSGNVVTINCATSMTSVAGKSLCELRFVDSDGNAFATSSFALYVKTSVVDGSTRDESDYDALYAIEDVVVKSEASAKSYSSAAQTSATNAATSASNAKSYMDNASASASAAKESQDAAVQSETNTKSYMDAASQSADRAAASEISAGESAGQAKSSASDAATSASNASDSATSAAKSAETAAGYSGAALYSVGVNPDTGHMALFYVEPTTTTSTT